jgi:hypothetical protein
VTKSLFHARAGNADGKLSCGIGLTYNILRIDYSFAMHSLGDTHWFGIGLNF